MDSNNQFASLGLTQEDKEQIFENPEEITETPR